MANERFFAMVLAQHAVFRSSTAGGTAISLFVAISGRTLGAEVKQTSLGDHQIRQSEQRHQLRRVLGQSAVTGLLQPEAILDDVEGVLDLGANTGLDGFELIPLPIEFLAHIERAPFARAHGDVPANLTFGFRPFLGPLIPGVAEALFLMTMKERLRLRDVIDVGRCTDHCMHQPRIGINPNVCLHAEVPLIALLGLMHFGVTLALRVLGRGRRRDDRRINDGAFAQHQALARQMRLDCGKDGFGQLVRFEQMAKLEQRRRIRRRFPPQVEAHKLADGLAVVERIFDTFVGQSQALLHDVHAQHPFQANRRTSAPFALRIERRQCRKQIGPRRDPIQLRQEALPPRRLALRRVFQVSKTFLHHSRPFNSDSGDSRTASRSKIASCQTKSARP